MALVELAAAPLVGFARRLGIPGSQGQHFRPHFGDRPRLFAVRLDEGDDVPGIGAERAIGERQHLLLARGPGPGEMLPVEAHLQARALDRAGRLVVQEDAAGGSRVESELYAPPALDAGIGVAEGVGADVVVERDDRRARCPLSRAQGERREAA